MRCEGKIIWYFFSVLYFCTPFSGKLTYGVTGNTTDFGSVESRFEP